MRTHMLVVLALTLGCFTGPAPRNHALAESGRGSKATIRTPKATVRGELIEVRDSALVLLTTTQIVVVPNRLLRSVRFENLEEYYVYKRSKVERINTFTRLSRFPAGAPAGVIDEIARATGRPIATQER